MQDEKETYGLIKDNHVATKDSITFETGIPLPFSIKDFLFEGWYNEIKYKISDITFKDEFKKFSLLEPLPNPSKIICLAFNYMDHAKEHSVTPPKNPVIFIKPRTTLCGTGSDIRCPNFIKQLDYEIELAVIIGNACKNVDEDGPWITSTDEIADPQNLQLITRINGQVRQNSSSKNMFIGIPSIISQLSKVMTLEKGDIIATGTPEGVAMNNPDFPFLKDGDSIEMEIEKLGKIQNTVKFID